MSTRNFAWFIFLRVRINLGGIGPKKIFSLTNKGRRNEVYDRSESVIYSRKSTIREQTGIKNARIFYNIKPKRFRLCNV